MICEPNEYGDAFDLTFRPVFTRSENPHYGEANGRVHQDYRRFSQVGWTSGSIVVDGNEHQFDRWFGWRDHSWGRPPPRGRRLRTVHRAEGSRRHPELEPGRWPGHPAGLLRFATDSYSGFFFTIEDENGKTLYVDGAFKDADGVESEVVSLEHQLTFVPDTHVFSAMKLQAKTANGETWDLDVTAMGRGLGLPRDRLRRRLERRQGPGLLARSRAQRGDRSVRRLAPGERHHARRIHLAPPTTANSRSRSASAARRASATPPR